MKYRNITIALGFLTTIISFLGIPISWKQIALLLIGGAVVALAYMSGIGHKQSL